MSKLFETVKVLHLEPTDVCQAACPLCARETDALFDKNQQQHLDPYTISQVFSNEQIAQLDKMFMCGNYGDPAAGKHTLDIYRTFRSVNPGIVLGMNTNGGLQNSSWWHELGHILNQPRDYVVFSIDGLSDTNSIYRKNVNWHKLMTNAEAFISSGGSAHWDMLVYEHNQHQVDDCERLAKDMGFTWFRAKVSKRQSNISWLKQPVGWHSPVVSGGNIDCIRNKDQSIYMNAKGTVYPCCWLGLNDSIDKLDTFESIAASWNTADTHPVCKKTCSTVNNGSSFTNQWQRETQLA